ncbi:hypothetical protein ACFLVX_03835 [Chloroflexota bacterium]
MLVRITKGCHLGPAAGFHFSRMKSEKEAEEKNSPPRNTRDQRRVSAGSDFIAYDTVNGVSRVKTGEEESRAKVWYSTRALVVPRHRSLAHGLALARGVHCWLSLRVTIREKVFYQKTVAVIDTSSKLAA